MAKPLAAALALFVLSHGMPALAQQVFTVDRLTDTGEGEGLSGDLRYCITNTADSDTITFAVTGTINLTRALPDVTRSISIEGPGPNLLTVRRNTGGNYRIFTVISGTVRISGLTITNGVAGLGGGVYNSGTLTISGSTIRSNQFVRPQQIGAGIYNSGNLIVSASTISENDDGGSGGRNGGGIYNSYTGTLTISDSTISRNVLGGGVFGQCGGATGAGVFNLGNLTISNSTISGNSAACTLCIIFTCDELGFGGGVYNYQGTLTISNSTVSNNYANNAGSGIQNAGFLYMRNTILAGNELGDFAPDLGGRLSSSGYNLIGNTSGGSGFDKTDLLNINPTLGPLEDNGGPTLTHALLTGSPAIDAGDPDFIGPPDFDQRGDGFPRIVNGIIDIGAFEVQKAGAVN